MIAEEIVAYARSYEGRQYKHNSNLNKIDCSLFTQMVYRKYNIRLGRTVQKQSLQGTTVEKACLQKGDLLFFFVDGKHSTNEIAGHVGIYAGEQTMIHCIPYSNFFITNLNKAHWSKSYLYARRILEEC
ncbi:C40 family peptidase [Paenibacillus sp. MMS20-IR301]|uniref:C40 family peptidase n=1 Tax=Paenibacillus sp. MMS20-IR301 TaxID=2895946 RepID=UPI0028E332ED|nr:C40 family peptidase [Paenibacillus sp. MMS20-IR301]WNS45719.1 C40 family peptidase [Paenibacillus sp. MMS20-IR301]